MVAGFSSLELAVVSARGLLGWGSRKRGKRTLWETLTEKRTNDWGVGLRHHFPYPSGTCNKVRRTHPFQWKDEGVTSWKHRSTEGLLTHLFWRAKGSNVEWTGTNKKKAQDVWVLLRLIVRREKDPLRLMKQLPGLPGQLGSSYLPAPNPPPHSAVWGQAGLCRRKRGGMGEEETLASPVGLRATGFGHPQDATLTTQQPNPPCGLSNSCRTSFIGPWWLLFFLFRGPGLSFQGLCFKILLMPTSFVLSA